MTRKQLTERMQRVLLRRRNALKRSLAGELEQLGPLDEPGVGDSVDAALDADYQEVRTGLVEAEGRELERIERALKRFREGRYGVCEACGKNIPAPRLRALPYATTCVRCQEVQEQGSGAEEPGKDWSRLPDLSGGTDDLIYNSFDHVG